MSIDDEDLGSEGLTENRQLQLFTDRYEFTRLFASYLNDDPPRQTILYFYGDGGNGKSLLLKFLQTFCSKRFFSKTWEQLKLNRKDRVVAEFIRNAKVGENCTAIPAVWHDFGLPARGEKQPQDPFYGLLMLRRNISEAAPKYKFKFPLFDFACVWYLHKNGKSADEIKRLFPLTEVAGLIAPVIDLVTQNPIGTFAKAGLDFFVKDIDKKIALYWQQRQLSGERLEEIRSKDVDTELIFELPKLLGEDLTAAMKEKDKPPRLVLFFDTHEKFWQERRREQGEQYFYRDEWFRRLLLHLRRELKIVVVVAGRDHPKEQLQWTEAAKFPIPQQYLDIQLLWHLSARDAEDFLRKTEITEPDFVAALIKYASINPEEKDLQVHPFYLGLCADVVLIERQRGITLQAADFAVIPKLENKTRELTDRLLRYVDEEVREAVHCLSACRAFNDELYFKLGEECHFQATAANFRILKRFSFVWQDRERGKNWFRIHDLLRRLDYETENPTTGKAHEVLETHYREVGNLPEAVYHANRLDWRRGVDEWKREFDAALERSNYQLCRSFLSVRSDFCIKSDFQLGRISQSEGDYFAQLAQYAEAQQEYLEAIAAYNRELSLTPDDTATLHNKGSVLQSLGDLQTQLSESDAAKKSYNDAIAAFDEALNLTPNDIYCLNNKGNALQSLGDLQTQLSELDAAKKSYNDAIAAFDEALNLTPNDIDSLNNKGLTLQSLGDLQTQMSQFETAKQSYNDAIAAFDEALNLTPNHIFALNNKGLTLQSLGDLQTQMSQFETAKQSYADAITDFDSALNLAPNHISTLNNKGLTLKSLGDLQSRLSDLVTAKQSYTDAITAFNSALNLAPNHIFALNNKGNTLHSLGDLQTQLSESDAAKQSYTDAITDFDSALKLASNDIYSLNNKGLALQSLGELQIQMSDLETAKQSYNDAIAAFDSALNLASNDISALNNKGNVLRCLGEVQTQLNELERAKLSYTQAITAFDEALKLAQDNNYVLNNKGKTLISLGNLQAKVSHNEEAIESWKAAIEAFNRSLAIVPHNQSIRNLRDQLQEFLDRQK